MKLTAGAPAPVLVGSLERAGWGELGGQELRGLRATLGALSRLLPAGSAQGLATAEQIAAAAGYSQRWTSRCLAGLEHVGLLTWRRGGIAAGKPQPSWFRIDKRALLALVQIARDSREAATAALRARTTARIRGLRRLYIRSRTQSRRSVHVELGASLPPIGEGSGPPRAPDPVPAGPVDPVARAAARAAARDGVRQARFQNQARSSTC